MEFPTRKIREDDIFGSLAGKIEVLGGFLAGEVKRVDKRKRRKVFQVLIFAI